ncbi:MAG: hypothetical protein K6E85_04935 [Lachnospiraceae bacterium]|nr:hypothetical protein [Lachnospiraceae bacterium]
MIEKYNDQYELWYRSEGIKNLERSELNGMLVNDRKPGIMSRLADFLLGLIEG